MTDEKNNIEILECITSTNDYLKSLVREKTLPNGYTVIAKSQTAGRGRRGRSFVSDEGGLYMSVLLHPDFDAEKLTLITPVCAVCVYDAIKHYLPQLSPEIKWVNDIKLNGKKVCGILTEAVCDDDGKIESVVCGIGVNVYRPKNGFPPELADIAGYLTDEYRENLITDIGTYISRSLAAAVAEDEKMSKAVERYRNTVMTGMRVRTSKGIEGIAVAVDSGCRMLVRDNEGNILPVGEGELVII